MEEMKNEIGIMFNYYELDAIYQGISDYYCMDCCKKRGQNPCEKCGIDKIQKALVDGMNTLRQEYYDKLVWNEETKKYEKKEKENENHNQNQ